MSEGTSGRGPRQTRPSIVARLSKSNQQPGRRWLDAVDFRLVVLVFAIVAVGLLQDFASSRSLLWALLLFGGAGAVFVAYINLRQANVTLYLRGDRIGLTNFLGLRKEVRVDELAALVMCSVELPQRNQPLPLLIAQSKSGRCRFRFDGADGLSVKEIRDIATVAQLEIKGTWFDDVTMSELVTRYPGSLSYGERFAGWASGPHSAVTALGFVVTVVVLVSVLLVATAGH